MKKDLNLLLSLYREEVKHFLLAHPSWKYGVVIRLTPAFLKKAEKRIINAHKKYGNDWKRKNNIKERDLEELDHFNYTILNGCQKRYKKSRKNNTPV